MDVAPTRWHSWCSGQLSEGCKRCVEGRKLVLFITGMCAQKCWYCPIGENKYGHDVVFANEWKLDNPNDPVELLEEAKLTKATGAGITGGDPLARVDRCVQYITLLKKEFGKDFHIHLYTPLKLVSKENLTKLFKAGLDEIRFHPDLDDKTLWNRIDLAKPFSWTVGLEIPAIPGYE
ncbi:MAG: radical SAM protein, partial [Nanoarchaeota archaeon]